MKERIHEYCHRLHLPVMAERWSAMAEYAATHNIPYSEFLFRLLEAEIVEKQERSIQTLIKLSKLPYRKTIDTFDFNALPSVDERRIRELLTLSFILIRREDSHFDEAKRSKWEMNRLNYILLKIG